MTPICRIRTGLLLLFAASGMANATTILQTGRAAAIPPKVEMKGDGAANGNTWVGPSRPTPSSTAAVPNENDPSGTDSADFDAVPEPTTMVLMGGALIAVSLLGKRLAKR